MGDTVNVAFPLHTDWDHTARVMEDSYASFYLVGEVKVQGLTIASLNDRLKRRALPQGEGVVLTASLGSNSTRTSGRQQQRLRGGEVHTPGAVGPLDDLTLVEAISAAGRTQDDREPPEHDPHPPRPRPTDEVVAAHAHIYEWGSTRGLLASARRGLIPNTAIDDVDIFVDQWIRQMIPLPTLPISSTL